MGLKRVVGGLQISQWKLAKGWDVGYSLYSIFNTAWFNNTKHRAFLHTAQQTHMSEITASFLVSPSRFKTTTNIWSESYWSEIHLHLVCHVALLEDHPSKARSLGIPLQLQKKVYVLLRHRCVQKLKLSGDLKWKQNFIETHGIISTIRHHDGQRWPQNHELM